MPPLAAVNWMDAIGRWHPLLLHMPIGLLVALAWLRVMRIEARRAERSLLWLLVLSTWGAGVTGWLLHESSAYPDPVHLHEYLGIALLGLSMGLLWMHRFRQPWYAKGLALAMVLLVPTAHFGASLTHGPEFLWEPWQAQEKIEEVPEGVVSQDPADEGFAPENATLSPAQRFAHVAPILEARCARCHGERKRKGGLALHSFEALQRGGDSGPVLDALDPAQSELWLRLQLPLEDEDHMPPKNKRQLSAAEQEQLRAWLFGEPSTPLAPSSVATPSQAPPLDLESEPYSSARGVLERAGVVVVPAAEEHHQLMLAWDGAEPLDADQQAAVQTLAPAVVEVRFVGRPVPSPWLETLASLPALQRLDLSRCELEHADLRALQPAASLLEVRLARTSIGRGALERLLDQPQLDRAVLTGSGWREAYAGTSLPELPPQWIIGVREPTTALEQEPPVVFESDREPETTAQDSPNLSAVNTLCPVTGRPIDGDYRMVFEEQVIGFCCAQCLGRFAKDPEAYRSALPD